ncbi:MAG: MFS transporter [Alcaligenaceae bacterium]|nr:MFS transporter [Alcaligenaceae bacterium]
MTTVPTSRTSAILLGACLILIAFNLRLVFSSLSVLLPEITAGLNMSGTVAGYLTTVPVLCMGVFAPAAPWLGRRIGTERSLLIVLVLLTIGTALRGADGIGTLFVGSIIAGGAIAIGNVLLPSLVKRDFASRPGLMTGLYTMSLCGGAAVAAAATLPLIHGLGSEWDLGVAMWAVPAVVVGLLWAPMALKTGTGGVRKMLPVRHLHRDPLAWNVTFFMGLQSALAYCVMGWLAPIIRERGVSGTEAGIVVSVSIMMQVVACLLVPLLASRRRDQRVISVTLVLLAIVGLLGMLAAPLWSIWIWAVIQGIGQGGLFAVAMMFIVLRSPDAHVAAQLSGMAQTIGYVLAAGGPLLVGILHDRFGSFDATAWLFIGLGVLTAYNGWRAGRNMLVRAEVVTT